MDNGQVINAFINGLTAAKANFLHIEDKPTKTELISLGVCIAARFKASGNIVINERIPNRMKSLSHQVTDRQRQGVQMRLIKAITDNNLPIIQKQKRTDFTMTKFEHMINGGNIGQNAINCMINDLKSGESFDAWINADTIQEIDAKLPEGYELDKITTFQNYFSPAVVDEFEIEIKNSQYIYFEKFTKLYDGGFYRYLDAMKACDFKTTERLDRKHQQIVK